MEKLSPPIIIRSSLLPSHSFFSLIQVILTGVRHAALSVDLRY